VNRTLVRTVKGTDPLPEVVGVGKIVVLISEGGGGGTLFPPVVVVMGVWGLPNEVETFSSITFRRTN